MAYKTDAFATQTAPAILRGGVNKETITTTKVLTYRDSTVQAITPSGGTKIVKLPAGKEGATFLICNLDGANALDVQTAAGVSLKTLAANNSGTPAVSIVECWYSGALWGAICKTGDIAFA